VVTETSAHTPEHHLLMLCLHFEELGKPLSHALPHSWIDTRHLAGLVLNRFLGEFEQDAWPGRDNLDALLESPRSARWWQGSCLKLHGWMIHSRSRRRGCVNSGRAISNRASGK
jgi:hypothetical protein